MMTSRKIVAAKAKKKIKAGYKPPPQPDFREAYDHLLTTSGSGDDKFCKVACTICDNEVLLFASLPKLDVDKTTLAVKIAAEQEYRRQMAICNKCYHAYKKAAL